ncbi:MAG: beta-galactosidase small subunit [Parabacteroides sp.]|nr:beta-galactosidase small subunit [Parabacteroides sp.]
MCFDRKTGLLSEYLVNGEPRVKDKVRFNFWRALTDNDGGWKVGEKLGAWEREAENYTLRNMQCIPASGNSWLVKKRIPVCCDRDDCGCRTTDRSGRHDRFPSGFLHTGKCAGCTPYGLQFEIDKNLQAIDWYGRGPQENYLDRKSGAAIGVHHSSVTTWITPYVRPQENANRSDVRWLRLSGPRQGEICFTATGSPFQCSAWPYTQQTLSSAEHDFELKEHANTVVNIDCCQMGVGGDNSWGLPVLDEYRLKPGQYRYAFVIQVK